MSRWANKYVIGLTGNIAVGKSVVRQMVQHLGAYTIDADGLAHQAMAPGAPAYKPIVSTFGQFILNPDKSINRAMLGQIVFSNPEAMGKLEAITHPIVRGAINTLISRAKQRVIVIEAIKLLEGEMKDWVDTVWVVDANPQTQYKRLLEKRKMSEADAKQRITAQNSQTDKKAKANLVINNDGNVEDTWKQVQLGWNEVRKAVTGNAEAAPPASPPAAPSAATSAPPKQAASPPAAAATAASPPAAPVAEEEEPAKPKVDTSGIAIKRGMPGNAEQIASFITQHSGTETSRMDVMMAFGQKSYLIAEDTGESLVAVMGWQVENLITRVDEFYIGDGAPRVPAIHALVDAVEEASKELQSEVGFIFLNSDTPKETIDSFLSHGYEITTIEQIKIPAWREAVQEVLNDQLQVLHKQLRKDRVLKPI